MKNLKYIFGIFMCCVAFGFAQQTPAPAHNGAFTIVGATAHIGNGQVINNCVLVVENGTITQIGSNTDGITSKGDVIDANGKHVYPGFIATNTDLGLVEINAVRATNDQDEIGDMIPNIRSLIAYNAESKVVESMRPNGILLAQVSPNGGRISGTSSIVQLDAWNWEDAALKADDGVHLNWPASFTRGRWWLGEPRGLRMNSNYKKQVQDVADFVADSKAYLKGNRATKNLAFEAMEGLFDGSQKLFVHVDDEKGITDAVHFANENGIQSMVVVGGYQAYMVASFLKANNVPVLINTTHSTPAIDDHDYDLPYKAPKLLADAGVVVGFQNGNMSNFQTRNLPFYAGQVAGQGMDKEEALKLITSNTAKILGIDDKVGTLEAGKDATLFISEGDALDMRGNNVTHAFINGRKISLETHQTKLWKRYSNKYKGQ